MASSFESRHSTNLHTILPMLPHTLLILRQYATVPNARTRSSDRTPSPLRLHRLFRIRVVNQQFALLVVPMRQLRGNLDTIERVRRLMEDLVHLLETPVRGLGKEEVHGWHDGGVDDGEDDVGLVADGGECDGCDHHDHEVESPVGSLDIELVRKYGSGAIHVRTVEIAFAGARMLRGVISAGYNQVMPSQPMAKKELKTKRNTV
jgi:hypothetical protein